MMIKPNREPEFIIVGVVHGERYSVLGRNGDVPIHVDDVFDAAIRYKPCRTADELATPPVREIEKSAAIRVVGIEALGRSLKFLGEGMTGSLTVEGDGLEYLAPGWILGRKSEPANGSAHEKTSSHLVTTL